jgi:membrane protease YdiL (CAAX protease family)
MKISVKVWVSFVLIAIFSFFLWFKLSYPQFAFIDLSVDRKKAQEAAEKYLFSRGINPKGYLKSVVFSSDDWADTYLQKTLGFEAEEKFIQQQNYEFFSWRVRFFREFQKEEYVLGISPKTGKILHFEHKIEDVEPRNTLEKEAARLKAQDFLKDAYGLNLADYDFHEEKAERYDQRTDYLFSWEKRGVYIPWKKDSGGAKLLCGATVSGNEIREFYRNGLDIPENFYRYIDKEFVLGGYLSSFSYLLFLALVVLAIFLVVKKRQSVTLILVKNWYVCLAVFLFLINTAYIFNSLQSALNNYATSASLASYIGLYLLQAAVGTLFLSITFTLPGIAAEAIQEEALPQNRGNSFLHYLKSSFSNRSLTMSIVLGYLFFIIILGLQAAVFFVGQKYLGVWKQWIKLTQFSSASIPLLSAFVIGLTASLNEEIIFRLFAISWLKKYLKNTLLAVVISALCWGFGHTQYAIFPIWFRGIEVSLIGLLYGFIFVKYGIIPLIVAHYLFDVFWGSAAYILGRAAPSLFFGSVAILALPSAFALFAWLANKKEEERQIKLVLNADQQYNLDLLAGFVANKKTQGQSAGQIKQELLAHGWDFTLVELAIAEIFKGG